MLLVALLVGFCMPAMAQTTESTKKSTFNVASISVEGVPQSARESFLIFFSLNVSLKQTALAEEGTKQLSLSMSKQDWSIIGLYEDYNYHTQLMSSLGNYSSYAKSDNGISRTDTRNSTDGLGLLVKSGYTLGDLLGYAQWSGGNGANILEYTQNGNLDKLVYRGYRCWPVTLPNGAIVDVYTFHLDDGVASSSSDYSNEEDKNAIARRNQIASLVSAIKTNAQKNKRPAIVMGLTNNLYTNEGLKQNLIDAVNGVDGLIIKDAWVELMRGGKYPTYPSADETPGSFYFNDQNGEVVNKVFYINNDASDYTIKANSYYRDVENFASLDHKPVVVNFTVEEKGAEDDDVTIDSESWVIPEDDKPTAETPSAVLGEVVSSGTKYFVKNVSSGGFLMAGADWGARACEGSAAMPITITKQGSAGSTYTLGTLLNYVFVADDNAERVFMDGGDSDAGNNYWVLEKVSGSETTVSGTSACQYYIYHSKYDALTSTGNGEYGNLVYCTPLDRNNDKQKWVLLTSTNMRKFMSSATVSNPFDITPFMFGGADFGRLLVQRGDASTWGTENGTHNNEFDFWYNHDGSQHNDGFAFRTIIDYNSSHPAITVEKNLPNMPQGTYHLSFEGFYHVSAQVDGRNQHLVLNIPVTLGANWVNLYQNNEAAWATKSDDWGKGKLNEFLAIFRDGDAYRSEVETTLSEEGSLAFKFSKPEFTAGTQSTFLGDFPRRSLVALDNFSIKYFGANADNSVKILVYNYLQQTAAKVALLNEAGQAAYDVSEVIRRYNSNALSSDGSVEIAMIDAAYEIALRAHNAKEAEDALEENDGDVTGLIVNPSFEQGITGWTVGAGWDCGVRDNGAAGSTYYVDNAHSDVSGESEGSAACQLYNGWSGDVLDMGTYPVTQTITGLKNGLYELKALVTSYSGETVYIIGNSSHAGVVAKSQTHFEEATLQFLVEDGTARIGAVGGVDGHYYPRGCFFKADNFRLRYICDAAHGRVYLAHQEASAVLETFDAPGKAYANDKTTEDNRLGELLTTYQNADQGNIASLAKSDGVAEAAAIYEALTKAALQQKTPGTDMTWCLSDPSFELGKYTDGGWKRFDGWDVKAAKQDDVTYSAVGVQGSYLFNSWNDQQGITNSGVNKALTTTITGIPNGTYRLSAMVSSDNGNTIFLMGNNTRGSVVAEHILGEPIDTKVTNTMTITPGGQDITTTNVDGGIHYSTSSSYSSSGKRLELGKNGSLAIEAVPNSDETLTITKVVVQYREATTSYGRKTYYYGNNVSATVGDNTITPSHDSENRKYTVEVSNAPSVTLKNGSGSTALHITSIEVSYERNYKRDNILLEAKNKMHEASVDFEVTDGTATIGVVGGKNGVYDAAGGCWYKCDDFHLQLLLLADNDSQNEEQYAWNDVLYLDQDAEYIPELPRAAGGNTYNYKKVVLDRPVAGGVWNTFVVPFAMNYKNDETCDLYGWEVKQLDHISLDETGQVVMSFADAPSIMPGVSYMIRNKYLDGNLGVIEHGNGKDIITVNTTFTATTDGSSTHPTVTYTDGNITLKITGVYTTGYVPKDSYFINNNKFYQAEYDNKNRLRGYRAYITITGPQGEARKLSFRIGEGTGIDAANNDEVTVVGIYNLSGMRLNDMEPGVNILQMSDGTTMKVIIK